MTKLTARPIMLIVRDGWGSNPNPQYNDSNAIYLALTPVDDRLSAAYPHVLIHTSGKEVGLPAGIMGNSEVGHQNIGAGRIVEQEIMRITGRIRDGSFFTHPTLVSAFDRAAERDRSVHIMGLCSDGRVHSDLEHLYGLLELSVRRGFPGDRVFVHAFTDGRDTPPDRGAGFIEAIEEKCRELGIRGVASVIGRFYAMDRDGRWGRVERAYRLLTQGEGRVFSSAVEAVKHHYHQPADPNLVGDEFVEPSLIMASGESAPIIHDSDSVVFFNYRGDRPRELCRAFTMDRFPYEGVDKSGVPATMGFSRQKKLDLYFVTLTRYEQDLPVEVAFEKPPKMCDTLGAYVSDRGLRQFRAAETEKFPHVTFFFNDYRDAPHAGEDRLLVPSPRDVDTYDLEPDMSARELTDGVIERIKKGIDDLMVVNLANGDMVGHTGNLKAAVQAVETVDECVGRLVDAVQAQGGGLIVTADHGNCEQMIDPSSGRAHTAHTNYDVELIVVDERFRHVELHDGGRLADVAPTLLEMMGLPKPDAMKGNSLIAKG